MNPEQDDDKNLNAAMNSWQAPPLSPWLKERVQARMAAHAVSLRTSAWPWSPLRMAAGTVAAAALGCMLAFVPPASNQSGADETLIQQSALEQTSEQASDQTGDQTAGDEQVLSDRMDDNDDMIALLW